MDGLLFKLMILCVCTVKPSAGLYSKWLRNTDLNNPYNWDRGNLPCGNDRMIIPDDGPVVFIQFNTTIQELVLPRSGEMVFGSYATLAFTNEPDHSADCLDSGSDITFNASHPADWFDGMNWCPTVTELGPCKPLTLLHSEQIPCETDDVVFPTGSSYYVDLGVNMNIRVNTLKVSGKAYSSSSFRDFLATDNGRNIFPVSASGPQSTVTIKRHRCSDVTGCSCGNDQGQILAKVCQVQSPRCTRPRCSNTIKPVGHCCDICGGMLNVSFGVGFNIDTLKNGLQRNFLDGKDAYKDVKYIVSKRSDGRVLIVLLDDDGVQSSKVTAEIMAELTADIGNGGVKYSVTQVQMASSATGGSTNGGGSHSAHTGGEKQSMGGGSVAGITMGVIVAIIIAVAAGYLLYRNKKSDDDLGFSATMFNKFNRFNVSQQRKPQVSVPPSVGFSWGSLDSGVSSVSAGTSQGFENPIYGSVPLENIKSTDLELRPCEFDMSDTQPDNRGFDNPLYDVSHQESLFSDPTEVDKPELPTVMTIGASNQDTDA